MSFTFAKHHNNSKKHDLAPGSIMSMTAATT
jgi:hypothetical protein